MLKPLMPPTHTTRGLLFVAPVIVATLGAALFLANQSTAQPARPAPKGAIQGRLTWFDRNGKALGTIGEPGEYRTMTISPDAKRVAVERADSATQNRDIWVIEVATNKAMRFTSDPGWDAFPLWSPDGSRIIFTSNRGGSVYDLYEKPSNGSSAEVPFYKSTENKGPTSWTPDGRYLLYYSLGQPTHARLLAASGPADRTAIPVVDAKFQSITPRFSGDGHWIAYTGNEFGKTGISVRPFDSAKGTAGAAIQVSDDGGRTPLWRRDGKEIFYLSEDGAVIAREVNARKGFHAGKPTKLFQTSPNVAFWDSTPDGKRFLIAVAGR